MHWLGSRFKSFNRFAIFKPLLIGANYGNCVWFLYSKAIEEIVDQVTHIFFIFVLVSYTIDSNMQWTLCDCFMCPWIGPKSLVKLSKKKKKISINCLKFFGCEPNSFISILLCHWDQFRFYHYICFCWLQFEVVITKVMPKMARNSMNSPNTQMYKILRS